MNRCNGKNNNEPTSPNEYPSITNQEFDDLHQFYDQYHEAYNKMAFHLRALNAYKEMLKNKYDINPHTHYLDVRSGCIEERK